MLCVRLMQGFDGRSWDAQVTVGRLAGNTVCIEDSEVSSTHCLLTWDPAKRVWQVMDLGSLNGTRLNGNFISNTIRRPGKNCRLRTDDILLLGSRTAIKVRCSRLSARAAWACAALFSLLLMRVEFEGSCQAAG